MATVSTIGYKPKHNTLGRGLSKQYCSPSVSPSVCRQRRVAISVVTLAMAAAHGAVTQSNVQQWARSSSAKLKS